MPTSIKALAILGLTVLLAACAGAAEEEVMEEPMVMEEPSMDKM